MNQDQLNKLRECAGISPKFDRAEREHLDAKAAKKTTEQKNLTEAANNRAPANVMSEIARRHLNIRSLATANSDDKDFHEVSVWAIEAALKAAYKAGQAAAPKRRGVKEGDESKAQAKDVGVEYDPKGGERYPKKDTEDGDDQSAAPKTAKKGGSEDAKSPKNKTAKQVSEAKKADKDHDGDGKVESSEAEHKGSKDKAIKAAMKKNAKHYGAMDKSHKEAMSGKKKVTEMDLELDMGDEMGAEEGDSDMKQRRMDLIRRAADKVRGGGDVVDVGDELDDEDSAMAAMDAPMGDEDMMDDPEAEMSGEMDFGGDFEFGEEDCEMAMGAFQPEDEESFAAGFDSFRRGEPQDAAMMQDDYKNGYETARFTRMSSVAEGSSEGYSNPKGNKLKADAKSGVSNKMGKECKTVHHKDDSRKAKSEDKGTKGLKNIKEAEDATVFDKDYHYPVGAKNDVDMAQHTDKPHVQDGGQLEKVKVPADVKTSLKEEIKALRHDATKVRYRDEYRADFYENTADVFEMLLAHLEEGTRHNLLLAQIDMNRVMSPMTHRIPRNTYMYIVRGGKPASLNELFHEVKVKSDKGVDPSKEDYNG